MTFSVNPKFKLTVEQREQRNLQKANFPNQISVGSFTPHSTIVEALAFRADVVEAAIQKGALLNVRKDIQVLCHEMTHWFDFFGTCWGRSYLTTICKAYRAVERHREDDFPSIIALFDRDRHILSPSYYRFTRVPEGQFNNHRPWRIGFTCGVEIDSMGRADERKPIYLVNFGNADGGAPFARQPISVGALLEVRAIASEISAALTAIETEPEEGPKQVEKAELHREFGGLAYDHNLIEYNTAFHVLSHRANIPNLYVSSRLASRLAYIALNMQEGDFRRLKIPSEFSVFGNRNRAFIRNMDRGYAYACLIWNGGAFEGDEDAYVKQCLIRSGLGSTADLLARAIKYLKEPQYSSMPSRVAGHFFREALMSASICEIVSNNKHYRIDFSMIFDELRDICPPFMNADGDFVEVSTGRLDEYNPEMMHIAAHGLRNYTLNLMTGCRGFTI